jgi:hypothetical protein
MGNIVTSTADILAIIGGATTLCLGIFGAVRYSRCRTVSCCWNGCILQNEPPGAQPDKKKETQLAPVIDPTVPRTDSMTSIAVAV